MTMSHFLMGSHENVPVELREMGRCKFVMGYVLGLQWNYSAKRMIARVTGSVWCSLIEKSPCFVEQR